MLLSRVLIATLLLLCLFSDTVFGQVTSTVPPTNVSTLSPTEGPPWGFWRGIFYNLKKMFFRNKQDNAKSVQELTNIWNQSLTAVTRDLGVITTELKSIGGDFGEVLNLRNSSKDIIGKALTVGATAITVFADLLNIFNKVISLLNTIYQSFNSITDNIYDTFHRNYHNFEKIIKYPPTEVALKLLQLYRQLMAVLDQIRAVLEAIYQQIQILFLQMTVFVDNRSLPLRIAFAYIRKTVNDALLSLINKVNQLQSYIGLQIKQLMDVTSAVVKNTVDTGNNIFKGITDSLKKLKEQILGGFLPKPKPTEGASITTTAASGKETTAASVASTAATTAAPVKS